MTHLPSILQAVIEITAMKQAEVSSVADARGKLTQLSSVLRECGSGSTALADILVFTARTQNFFTQTTFETTKANVQGNPGMIAFSGPTRFGFCLLKALTLILFQFMSDISGARQRTTQSRLHITFSTSSFHAHEACTSLTRGLLDKRHIRRRSTKIALESLPSKIPRLIISRMM